MQRKHQPCGLEVLEAMRRLEGHGALFFRLGVGVSQGLGKESGEDGWRMEKGAFWSDTKKN